MAKHGIQNSWSLLAFARTHGNPRPNTSTNTVTNEVFHNLVFEDNDGSRTFVAFSSELGVLSPAELIERKDNLQVVKLKEHDGKPGGYILCKAGNLNLGETIVLV